MNFFRKHKGYFFIAFISVVALAAAGVALWRGEDLGEISTAVQALFGIVLVFATISAIQRTDQQIEKTQKQIDTTLDIETKHTIALQSDLNLRFSISNINRHFVLIESIIVFNKQRDSVSYVTRESLIIAPGKQHSFELFGPHLPSKGIMDQQVDSSFMAAHDSPPIEDILKDYGVSIAYKYGGTASAVYSQEYTFEILADSHFVPAIGRLWMLTVKPVERTLADPAST